MATFSSCSSRWRRASESARATKIDILYSGTHSSRAWYTVGEHGTMTRLILSPSMRSFHNKPKSKKPTSESFVCLLSTSFWRAGQRFWKARNLLCPPLCGGLTGIRMVPRRAQPHIPRSVPRYRHASRTSAQPNRHEVGGRPQANGGRGTTPANFALARFPCITGELGRT